MSNLVEHAKREFKAIGYKPIEECEDDPNKWIQEGVLELLEVFGNQGHSGMSAPYAIQMFSKLAKFEPLAPLTGEEFEWNETEGLIQNNRLSSVFKDTKNDKSYFLNAIIWQGEESFDSFSGSVEGVSSRQYIKSFPFEKKTFRVDVIRVPFDSEKHDDYFDGDDGKYVYQIKNRDQLKEVFDYYDEYKK